MTVYISGAISKDPDHAEKFAAAFVALAEQGCTPVNPVAIGRELKERMGREPEWTDYMRACIKALMDCDRILMLPGWRESRGATIEAEIAQELGIKRVY